jgi:hypothetical protein
MKAPSNIAIWKQCIKNECATETGYNPLFEQDYPEGGEPVIRSRHVGDYLILIISKPKAREMRARTPDRPFVSDEAINCGTAKNNPHADKVKITIE